MAKAHVRFVAVHSPCHVDCNAEFIAASSEATHTVSLHAWADGTLQWELTDGLSSPMSLRLLPHSSRPDALAVVDRGHDSVVTVDTSGAISRFARVEYECEDEVMEMWGLTVIADGYLVLIDNDVVRLAVDGSVVAVFGRASDRGLWRDVKPFKYPLAMATLPGGGLVVREVHRVIVFRPLELRLAWVAAVGAAGAP